ncbi:MAG: rhodanese-like domain-containing protein [Eubacteriales bacterium]|nr:rhodanese-like domain-containing protein [Eubacteriales bacterium]
MKKRIISILLVLTMFVTLTSFAGVAGAEASFAKATVEEVKEALANQTAVVVDARSNDAYAGWATKENALGGHIAGATDFSANWLTATFDDKNNLNGMTREEHLQKYMEDKKITSETPVIVYDESGAQALAVAGYLASKGVKNIKTFDLNEWKEELQSYPNYQLYLPPSVVNALLQGETVKEIGEVKDLKVLEVSWGSIQESSYLKGHVPTALHVNSDDFDNENNFYLLESDETLLNLAKSLGITTESTVVTTGDAIFSARYATLLKYLGVKNVYVMSGGVNGWANAGFEMETTENKPVAVEDFGTTTPQNPDIIDTVDEVKTLKENPDFVLVDNRTKEEFAGKTSGYGYFDIAGRIEGAVYGYAGVGNASSMLYYKNLDDTMRNGYEILDMWAGAGIDVNKHLSFYCGGGYRAAEVLWDAYVMGLTNVSLFSDGWCGWSSLGNPYIVD